MQDNKVKFLMEKFGNEITDTTRNEFFNKLREAPDEAFESMTRVPLKKKAVTLVLSIFLGGVSAGRFYVGMTRSAVIKLVVLVAISIVSAFLGALVPFISLIGMLPGVIWGIYDMVKSFAFTREANTEKLFSALRLYSR